MSISEPQFDEFERTVEHEFNFLQNYGFKKACLQKIDFEYPQDKRVEVNYFSETVCVTIRWFLIYANLEVGLIELIDTKLPEKISFYGGQGYGRAISLVDLVELMTRNKTTDPLPSPHSKASIKELMSAWKNRDKLIQSDLPGLIAKYARALESFGTKVLGGDLSVFSAVQAYSKTKL
jgi:hypothetical protein